MGAPSRADASLASLMTRQHGLIARSQAISLGYTRGQIDYRLSTGEWVRVDRGVFRSHLAVPSWKGRLLSACMASGGVASHRSAAVLWELDGFKPIRPEIALPKQTSWSRPGVRVHETTLFHECQATAIDGIPTTGIERTLIDLAKVVSYQQLRQAVDSARLRQLVEWPDVGRCFSSHARRGRDGIAKMRLYLEEHLGEASIPLSDWSRLVADLLTESGLPKPELEYEVVGPGFRYQLDLAYPRLRLGFELDSVTWHLNRRSFEEDRRRLNRLQNLGWSMRLFSWDDYSRKPNELVRTVRIARDRAIQMSGAMQNNPAPEPTFRS